MSVIGFSQITNYVLYYYLQETLSWDPHVVVYHVFEQKGVKRL
jgi:hypothetical protein